jgi:hypothetical protein
MLAAKVPRGSDSPSPEATGRSCAGPSRGEGARPYQLSIPISSAPRSIRPGIEAIRSVSALRYE